MGKCMFHATYTGKGLTGLLKEGGSRRRQALKDTVEAMGGSVEGPYYAFGDTDLYILADLPDDATAKAVSLNRPCRCPQYRGHGADHARNRG